MRLTIAAVLVGALIPLLGCRAPRNVGSVETDAIVGGPQYTSAACQINRPCRQDAIPPPRCTEDLPTMSVPDLLVRGDALLGQAVRVRGPLSVREAGCTAAECFPGQCCNECTGGLVVGDPESSRRSVLLRHLPCHGDDSKVCCGMQAVGQEIVVVGKLVLLDGRGRSRDLWLGSEPRWPYAIEADGNNAPPVCAVSAAGL
jgi:hypothetical protein